jgi:hypothetical protein
MYAVGLVVVTAGTTAAFLAMRDVMAIGGSCASGGPYEIAVPCPKGTGLLIMGGIVAWLVGAGITLIAGSDIPGDYGNVAILAWPGLFLSFAWNFIEFGLDPVGGDGVNGGMLFCGVLFFLMGGLPLVFGIKAVGRSLWPRGAAAGAAAGSAGPTARVGASASSVLRPAGVAPAGAAPAGGRRSPAAPDAGPPTAAVPGGAAGQPGPAPRGDIVGELERLAGLRSGGAIDDDEYERAKDILLGQTGEDAR